MSSNRPAGVMDRIMWVVLFMLITKIKISTIGKLKLALGLSAKTPGKYFYVNDLDAFVGFDNGEPSPSDRVPPIQLNDGDFFHIKQCLAGNRVSKNHEQ